VDRPVKFSAGRRFRARLAGVAAIVVWLEAAATPALAAESTNPPPAVSDEMRRARQALRELDRFLDHHPLLEDDLRLAPARLGDADYLQSHPELRDFLAANPGVVPALAHEPRHILHRALMLQASEPLRWSEIVQLDPLLDAVAPLEHELARRPELIHDEAFQRTHARLRELLTAHPALGRAFLPAGATRR
jgi:hypothetical protein